MRFHTPGDDELVRPLNEAMQRLEEQAESLARPPSRFGEVRWSEYFGSRIVVVDWRSDDEWLFVVERGPYAGRIMRARTRLSAMPEAQRVAGTSVRAW